MEISAANIEEMVEALREIHDRRRQSGNFRHRLIDILVIALVTMIAGEDEYEAMEAYGAEREEFFRRFLELPNGIPGEWTFERIFQWVEPRELLTSMQGWLQRVSKSGGREVNIDGKTICGSADGDRHAVHVVSAWVGAQNLVLGQMATDEKSNEITAIPQLLDTIDVTGDTVTIDAMGCQKDIAGKIRRKGADYVLMVKENHPVMYEEIKDYFDWIDMQKDKAGLCEEWHSGVEKDHGRIERREITTAGVQWFADKGLWQDLRTLVRYRCTRTTEDKTAETGWKTSEYDRYYISSLEFEGKQGVSAERFGQIVRQHWSVENQLHWSLDVSFGEDRSRIRKNHAPENMNILRKLALNRLRATKTEKKLSVRRKQLKSLLNQDFLCTVLFGES